MVVTATQPYLEGSRYTIRTDHDALKCILNPAEYTLKLARIRLWLSTKEIGVVICAETKQHTLRPCCSSPKLRKNALQSTTLYLLCR